MGHVKMMGVVQPFYPRHLEDGHPRGDLRRRGRRASTDAQLGSQGDRHLPRQLQGRAAACTVGDGRAGARTSRWRGGVASPRTATRSAGVPCRRLRGLHPRRPTTTGRPGDTFVDIAKEGTTLGRPHELAHDLSLARPSVRRPARGLRPRSSRTCASSRAAPRTTRISAPPSPRRLHLPLDVEEVPRHGHQQELGILSPASASA